MNKKELQMYKNYINSDARTLSDVYKKFSANKELAQDNILHEMQICNGYDFRITSYNSNFFCCAYKRYNKLDDKIYLVYHKPSRKYVFEII